MNKTEFEILAGKVTDVEFEIINFVYTFHPAINNIKGKAQIADIYKNLGMRVIRDMYPTAYKAKELEDNIRKKKNELDSLMEELTSLREG